MRTIMVMDTTMSMATPMTTIEPAALVRLVTMLSPAFPVGAFAYSGGLEQAAHDGQVTDRWTLADWLHDVLESGVLWNDAVLVAESWRRAAAGGDLGEVNELALALAGSAGRLLETTAQGRAFAEAARVWTDPPAIDGDGIAYPVAIGRVAALCGIALAAVLPAHLNAAISNLVQAAIRLGVVGQAGGLAVIAGLEPLIVAVAERAGRAGLDDLGGSALAAEIAAMKHETLAFRMFRT